MTIKIKKGVISFVKWGANSKILSITNKQKQRTIIFKYALCTKSGKILLKKSPDDTPAVKNEMYSIFVNNIQLTDGNTSKNGVYLSLRVM